MIPIRNSLPRMVFVGMWLLTVHPLCHALDITGCPALVPPGEVGVVQTDFDCVSGAPENPYFGIVLGSRAVLDLNGHTVTYVQTERTLSPVFCTTHCEVHGPGAIVSAPGGGAGIWIHDRARASVHDLTITGVTTGILAISARLSVANVSIHATSLGIDAVKRLALDHVDVVLPGEGAGDCLSANQRAGRVMGADVTLRGCRTGVQANGPITLTRLTVQESNVGVFSSRRIELTDSSVTGSTLADIYTARFPRLTGTTCDHSLSLANVSWGVCASD